MDLQQVRAILVNIFAGIVDCNMIARGMIAAFSQVKLGVPVVVRLEGNNAAEVGHGFVRVNMDVLRRRCACLMRANCRLRPRRIWTMLRRRLSSRRSDNCVVVGTQ